MSGNMVCGRTEKVQMFQEFIIQILKYYPIMNSSESKSTADRLGIKDIFGFHVFRSIIDEGPSSPKMFALGDGETALVLCYNNPDKALRICKVAQGRNTDTFRRRNGKTRFVSHPPLFRLSGSVKLSERTGEPLINNLA